MAAFPDTLGFVDFSIYQFPEETGAIEAYLNQHEPTLNSWFTEDNSRINKIFAENFAGKKLMGNGVEMHVTDLCSRKDFLGEDAGTAAFIRSIADVLKACAKESARRGIQETYTVVVGPPFKRSSP